MATGRMQTEVYLCAALFGAFGFTLGSWQGLLPDLQNTLGLSPLQLGICLTAGFSGALPAMFMGGRLVARLGAKVLLVAAALGMAGALAGVGFAGGFAPLIPLVLVLLGSSGSFDVGINATAIAIEQASGRHIMPAMHGLFSLSAAVGALCSGAYGPHGLRTGYLCTAGLLLAFALWLSRWRALPQTRAEAPSGPSAGRSLLGTDVMLVAGIVSVSFLGSGILENWSAIYVRDVVSDSPLVSSLGLASFHGAMALGRLLTAALLNYVGRLTAIAGCGLLVAVAMAGALAASTPAGSVAGLFAVGLLLSGIAPIGFSVAGDLRPGRIGEVSSVVAIAGYMSFLLGPLIVGVLADLYGLRAALASVAVVGLVDSLLAVSLMMARKPAALAEV